MEQHDLIHMAMMNRWEGSGQLAIEIWQGTRIGIFVSIARMAR
jgi:hypothetical protein